MTFSLSIAKMSLLNPMKGDPAYCGCYSAELCHGKNPPTKQPMLGKKRATIPAMRRKPGDPTRAKALVNNMISKNSSSIFADGTLPRGLRSRYIGE